MIKLKKCLLFRGIVIINKLKKILERVDKKKEDYHGFLWAGKDITFSVPDHILLLKSGKRYLKRDIEVVIFQTSPAQGMV
jgi:hypothetical protein